MALFTVSKSLHFCRTHMCLPHTCTGVSVSGHGMFAAMITHTEVQITCLQQYPRSVLAGLTLALTRESMVACVSVGPNDIANPKSATLAVRGRLPASVHTSSAAEQAMLPAVSSTFAALRSPCLHMRQTTQNKSLLTCTSSN